MKRIIVATAALVLLTTPVFAKSTAQIAAQDNMKSCSASWKAMSDTDKKKTKRKDFMSSCLSKSSGASTAAMAAAPAAATPNVAKKSSGNTMSSCAASWKAKSDTDKKATKYKDFMSSCMKSNTSTAAMAPAASKPMVPASATSPKRVAAAKSSIPTEGNSGTSARCKDGKVISIKSHTGACSHHGGVAAWL